MLGDLPALDVHAHVAGDVTQPQLDSLGDAVVFAMTRSTNEARYALRPDGARSPSLVWAVGTHPGVPASLTQYEPGQFADSLERFAVVGEVGLDRAPDQLQTDVFRSILDTAEDQPVVLSVHSTGACARALDEISSRPVRAVILHWFNGTRAEVARATELGCWFSVNAAMSDATLRTIPLERLLTETDFPSARRQTSATRPGDVREIEKRLLVLHGIDIRAQVWRNLAKLVDTAGVAPKLPLAVQQVLSTVP